MLLNRKPRRQVFPSIQTAHDIIILRKLCCPVHIYTDVNKNASLIITDFLTMVYKNKQPQPAYLCRGRTWKMTLI